MTMRFVGQGMIGWWQLMGAWHGNLGLPNLEFLMKFPKCKFSRVSSKNYTLLTVVLNDVYSGKVSSFKRYLWFIQSLPFDFIRKQENVYVMILLIYKSV